MTPQRQPKILIISSDTGGGHRSAAAAIVAGVQHFLEGESYAIRVVRAVDKRLVERLELPNSRCGKLPRCLPREIDCRLHREDGHRGRRSGRDVLLARADR